MKLALQLRYIIYLFVSVLCLVIYLKTIYLTENLNIVLSCLIKYRSFLTLFVSNYFIQMFNRIFHLPVDYSFIMTNSKWTNVTSTCEQFPHHVSYSFDRQKYQRISHLFNPYGVCHEVKYVKNVDTDSITGTWMRQLNDCNKTIPNHVNYINDVWLFLKMVE